MYTNNNQTEHFDIMNTIESTDIYNSSYLNSLRNANNKYFLIQDKEDRLDLIAKDIYANNDPNIGILLMLNKLSDFKKGNRIKYV
jgi:hypothetical protein